MSWLIISQPNGNHAIWSTVTSSFIAFNLSREGVIQNFVKRAAEEARANIIELLDKIDRKENPYFQLGMSWDECLESLEKDDPNTFATFQQMFGWFKPSTDSVWWVTKNP